MLANDIAPVASSPLGRLQSKMGPTGASLLTEDPTIKAIAAEHKITPVQVCLAWGLARGCAVIPKATSLEHQQENFDALSVSLTPEQIADIDKLNKNEILFKSSPDVKFNMLA